MRTAVFVLSVAAAVVLPATQLTAQVTRLGARDAYGPGIVGATSQQLQFELTRPAHVIVLRVDVDGTIEPVFPQAEDSVTQKAASRHVVAAAEFARAPEQAARPTDPVIRSADALAREGRRARPSAAGGEDQPLAAATAYWLLIVSDVATSAAEVQARLEATNREFPTMQAELDGLTRALMGRRTRQWAAFYTPARD
jgi:hypothetical protein